ncbi:uncharacterized protein CELE_H38K22.7 [Caenorhabditis elegans]|uniref:Uncharacterized protein n=1 Tax=Caenorhabditis elegans TaxID=6239 RepID=Q0WKU3_CAEEL|nr:Uncharacterized protein CELE_H38K22.7 [Caenorhabditis elegans]CAL22708.1 Uncharacterized protein CELE_H38K22.7 [Caenorhabditis elegans]|eukprot:NP_001076642.1 Uncharacterized protein CELE_H38K22.7 [Caenorhabditis elegans]
MHSFWFILDCIFLFSLATCLVQCEKSERKKFRSDKKAKLVGPKTKPSQKSVENVHCPVSQAPPTSMPIESSTKKAFDPDTDDTLANVVSIQPDLSTGAPPIPAQPE